MRSGVRTAATSLESRIARSRLLDREESIFRVVQDVALSAHRLFVDCFSCAGLQIAVRWNLAVTVELSRGLPHGRSKS